MAEILVIVILVLGPSLGVLIAFGRRWLLSWYLHEIRQLKIADEPREAIITYPLA